MEIGIQIVSEIRQELETILDRCGIMYRLFARGKSKDSIEHKINAIPGKYTPNGKKIQDGIGFRIVFLLLRGCEDHLSLFDGTTSYRYLCR